MSDQGVSVPSISAADLAAAAATNLDLMRAELPPAASGAPPAVGEVSVKGSAMAYARADHTHKSSVQRSRVSVPLTAGRATVTFPTAYDVAVTPVVQVTAETPNDNTYFYDARIVSGTVTNTGFQVMINKINATQTLGGTLAALIGAVVNIFTPATGSVVVHCWAAPSTS